MLNTPSLYELAAVDRQQWTILSIDLATEQGQTRVTVSAFDRTRHGTDSVAELDRLAKDGGGVSVTACPVPAEQATTSSTKPFGGS